MEAALFRENETSDPSADAAEWLMYLDSPERHLADEMKGIIRENLNSTREPWLLNGLVDYFLETESPRCLEILIEIREPHYKHLYDKLTESLKSSTKRCKTLELICHIIHGQPSWLHNIVQNKIIAVVLCILKTDTNAPNLMSALLVIASLLPVLPSLVRNFLADVFEVFTRLVAWNCKKPANMPEIYVLNLQVGVYILFNRLYSMYPCNFLAYLRSHYGDRDDNQENFRIFTETIKPMLERVKLHPLLVTASKESELNPKRWKKMQTHDIIVECAKISLDPVESIGGDSVWDMKEKYSTQRCLLSHPSGYKDSGYSLKENIEETLFDIAVEARPEESDNISLPEAQELTTSSNFSDLKTSPVISEASKASLSKVHHTEKIILKDVHEEISDTLVTSHEVGGSATPFCYTTQKLTDEPGGFAVSKEEEEEAVDHLHEEVELDEEGDPRGLETIMQEERSQLKVEYFVQSIKRLRYFSHCGPPPDIVLRSPPKRNGLKRSQSCPNLNNISAEFYSRDNQDKTISGIPESAQASELSKELCCQGPSKTSESAPSNKLLQGNSDNVRGLKKVLSGFDNQPFHMSRQNEDAPTFNFLSPFELLDRHLQLANDIYIGQLKSIPLTSTKNTYWTHFGGSPPADEIDILRNQILLLHNQLLFERHKTEIHAERNRRLLRKARKSRILGEQYNAMKDQLQLQENEIQNSKSEVYVLHKENQQLRQTIDLGQEQLLNQLKHLKEENINLNFSNKHFQSLLVQQKQENDTLRKELARSQEELLAVQLEMEFLKNQVLKNGQLGKNYHVIAKELILAKEMNEIYRNKIEKLKSRSVIEAELALTQEASKEEISELRHIIDMKTAYIEAYKCQIQDLETAIANNNAKNAAQNEIIESTKTSYKNELQAKEERIISIGSICQQQETHILELYTKLCSVPSTSSVEDAVSE